VPPLKGLLAACRGIGGVAEDDESPPNLLAFARRVPLQEQLAKINEAIRGVVEMKTYDRRISSIEITHNLVPCQGSFDVCHSERSEESGGVGSQATEPRRRRPAPPQILRRPDSSGLVRMTVHHN